MGAQVREGLAILCMGRSRKAVLAEIVAVTAATPVLWFAACVFMLLEPRP